MMKLIKTAVVLGCLMSGTLTHAADVVKIMNFTCPVCRASENLDQSIRDAVAENGGRFVAAPIPSDDTSGARERTYYAARGQGAAVEAAVRKSLYKGSQDMQMPLDDDAQTVAWLEDDLTNGPVKVEFKSLVQSASSPDAYGALGRAARLAVQSGAQALPTYIVMKNNRIVAAFDPQSVGSASLMTLRDAVVAAVRKADGVK